MSDELVERLAVVICESDTVQPMGWEDVTAHWQDNYRTQARAVLDALTRRIETVAQLDALPDRTVVRSREGVIYQRFRDNNLSGLYGEWSTVGYEVPSDSGEVSLPALLLWTPEEQ